MLLKNQALRWGNGLEKSHCWILTRKPHAARMLARLFRDRRSGGKLTVVASDAPLTSIDEVIAEVFAKAVVVNVG
jgi:hypothetical protein